MNSNQRLQIHDSVGCAVERAVTAIYDNLGPKGRYKIEIFRDGAKRYEEEFDNAVTNEGVNKLWDVMFASATQITGWVFGIIDNASYSSSPNTDTMASHAGWIEFTGYSEANRPAWGPASAATRAITNTSPVVFNINASGTLRGIFVTSNNTKGGTTGTLWSTALFSSTIAVTSGDQVKITYTVNA